MGLRVAEGCTGQAFDSSLLLLPTCLGNTERCLTSRNTHNSLADRSFNEAECFFPLVRSIEIVWGMILVARERQTSLVTI
eukprot:754730-Hanusia_phi.AAC.2